MTRFRPAAPLAALLAVALAVPAHSGEVDRRIDPGAVAAAIFGLATLAVIAHQANRGDDDRVRGAARTIAPRAVAPREAAPLARHGRPRDAWHRPRERRLAVPVDCARRVEMWGQRRTAFGTPCLRRSGVDVARLPRKCAADIHLGYRKVVAWGASCLHRAGVIFE